VPLFRHKGSPVVGFSRWGEGGVIVLATSWILSNKGIDDADNLVLVLNALHHRDPKKEYAVTFDEYHHGYSAEKGIWVLLGTPARLALAQVGMAFLILLFSVSRRFGRPVPLIRPPRPRSEYLTSMSSLLKRAGATRVVHRQLGERFLQDAAQGLSLPANAEPEAILEAAGRRPKSQAQELSRLVREATAADRVPDESSLLALAKRWHRVRKDLKKTK